MKRMRIKKEESFFLVTFKARTRFVRQKIGSIVGSIVGSIEGLSRVYRGSVEGLRKPPGLVNKIIKHAILVDLGLFFRHVGPFWETRHSLSHYISLMFHITGRTSSLGGKASSSQNLNTT